MQVELSLTSLLDSYFKEESLLSFSKSEYFKAYFYLSKCKLDIDNLVTEEQKEKKKLNYSNKLFIEMILLKLEILLGNKQFEIVNDILINDYKMDKSFSFKLNKIKIHYKVIFSNIFFGEILDSIKNIVLSFYRDNLLIDQDKYYILNFEDRVLSLVSSVMNTERKENNFKSNSSNQIQIQKQKQIQHKNKHKQSLDNTILYPIFKKLKKENLNKRLITSFRKLINKDSDFNNFTAFVKQFAKKGINMFSFRSYNSKFLRQLFENDEIDRLFNKYSDQLIAKIFIKMKEYINSDLDKKDITEYIRSFTHIYRMNIQV